MGRNNDDDVKSVAVNSDMNNYNKNAKVFGSHLSVVSQHQPNIDQNASWMEPAVSDKLS